jgi:hypothetical protein
MFSCHLDFIVVRSSSTSTLVTQRVMSLAKSDLGYSIENKETNKKSALHHI